MPRLILGPERRTHPLIWFGAAICTILIIAVIFAGLIIVVGYLIIRPKVPFLIVTYAHLDKIEYDQAGLMNVQIGLVIKAENDNSRAHASFSATKFLLSFHGLQIASLEADAFEVPKRKSVNLPYLVPSLSVPLDPSGMEEVDWSFKQDRIKFQLKGNVRTQWKVGILGSVKYWSHLDCQLQFFPLNGSSINSSHCSTETK